MKYTTIICIGLAQTQSFAICRAAQQLDTESEVKRQLDSQLPQESRHKFLPVDKRWLKTVVFVDPLLSDEYEPDKVSNEQKETFEKKEVYSITGKPEGAHRVCMFDPTGKLYSVQDSYGDDKFTQNVHPNGSISWFAHVRKGKTLEAYTVSSDGTNVRRVIKGKGVLKIDSYKPHEFTRAAYYKGEKYFHGYFAEKKLDFVWLFTDKEELLRWREGSEEFFFDNNRVWWGHDKKGKIKLKKLDGEYDRQKINPDRVKVWEGKYAECFAVFVKHYHALLDSAGYTWDAFGIDFVRKGKPFPDE